MLFQIIEQFTVVKGAAAAVNIHTSEASVLCQYPVKPGGLKAVVISYRYTAVEGQVFFIVVFSAKVYINGAAGENFTDLITQDGIYLFFLIGVISFGAFFMPICKNREKARFFRVV